MRISKLKKAIVCEGLKNNSKLFKKSGDGSIIVDKDNYYFTRDFLLKNIIKEESDSEASEGEIEETDRISSYQEYFLSKFESASSLWMDTFLHIPDFKRRRLALFDNLDKIDWNTSGIPDKLCLTPDWAEAAKNREVKRIKVGDDLYEEPELESGQLAAWIQDLKGLKIRLSNFIHFPMILCDTTKDESLEKPLLDSSTVIGKIIQSAKLTQTEKCYIALSNMERDGKTSSKVDKGDFAIPRLTQQDRIHLSKRGVQAKSETTGLKFAEVKKDKSLSPNLDTSPLEFYLSEQFKLLDEEHGTIDFDLDSGNNVDFTHKWFDVVSKISEFRALEFHDRVLSEVIANSTRNVDKDVFIVRKVKGYRAYVIIKPTSLGSVNDPKPIFYSIVFRGRSLNSIFEPVHSSNLGWSYTDFISTSRIRASHHMNSMPQFMMMIFENLETLSMLQEEPTIDRIQSIVEPIKWCLLAHLQDKEEFSSIVSNFRYYYFSLFSGFSNCKDEAELLVTKLPTVIRDPLTMLALRRLIRNHDDLDAEVISQQTSVLSARKMQEELSESIGTSDAEYDKLPIVQTPFGFNIVNSRTFLKAAYMSIYHNKDEAERGPAAKQIVSKLCGQEKHMTNLLESDETPESYDPDIGKDLGIYRFNINALTLGADLIKDALLDQSGIPKRDFRRKEGFDEWIEETILIPTLLKTTYDQLSSTRSSYVDNGEIEVSRYKRDRSGREYSSNDESGPVVGETIKCIEAVLQLRKKGVSKGLSPSDDLYDLVTDFKTCGSKLVIKIFKKNQLTGVREIYILTMLGRLLQRVLEDLARGICNNLHQEKLTGSDTKDSFVSEHKAECSTKSKGKKSVTINGSGDKTQWANYLHPKSVTFPLFRLLPRKYHALIAHVGNANIKKEIEIPSSLMESMLKHPDTNLENEVLNEIKGAVLSRKESNIASYNSSRLKCKGNTMQGICHYLSSLYHLCALMLLSLLIKKYLSERDLESHISFEVSSDDKGFMVTIFVEEDSDVDMLRLTIKTTKYMRYLERVIDSAFGIRDSRLKSVTTISVSFEFNSIFYFGNSITTPIAKFTARCCDDSIQSTLHNRVSSMFSSIRQIRDNGGSGILCSLATMAQHIVMKCNLGYKNFSWFDDFANHDYNLLKLSHTGYRRICNPITAGLAMSDFENIKFINDNKMGKAYSVLLKRDLDSEDVPEQIVLTTRLWATHKHASMMSRLNIVNHEMTEEESLLILGIPETPSQLNKKIELMASSNNLSRSFVQCQRSDLLRAGMYLLWHKAFKIDNERVNFHSLLNKLIGMTRTKYKVNKEYKSYMRMEQLNRFYILKHRRIRLAPRHFKPLINHSYARDDVVKYLRSIWMNQDDCPEQYLVDQITNSCTWICDTSKEFFDKYDPVMLHRFINSIPTRKTKLKLLIRGTLHTENVISCIMRDNTSADETMILGGPIIQGSDYEEARLEITKMMCRISRWVDAIYLTGNCYQTMICAMDDMKEASLRIGQVNQTFTKTRQEKLCLYMVDCLALEKEISTLACYKIGTSVRLNIEISKDSDANYYYTTHLGCPVLVRRLGNACTDIACQNNRVLELISKYSGYANASLNLISIDYRFKITKFGSSQRSLSIGSEDFMIGGFIGMPFSTIGLDMNFRDGISPMDAPSLACLKYMIECPTEIPAEVYDALIRNDTRVIRSLAYRIHIMEEFQTYEKFCRSTEIRLDSGVPNLTSDPHALFEAIKSGTDDEFLEFVTLIETAENESESESEQLAVDTDQFNDMYGENFSRIVPGVDKYEEEFKTKPDRIDSLEPLISLLRNFKTLGSNAPFLQILEINSRIERWVREGII